MAHARETWLSRQCLRLRITARGCPRVLVLVLAAGVVVVTLLAWLPADPRSLPARPELGAEALRRRQRRHDEDLQALTELRGARGVLLVGDALVEEWVRPRFRREGGDASCSRPCGAGSPALAALSAELRRPVSTFAIGGDRIEDLSARVSGASGQLRAAAPSAIVLAIGADDWPADVGGQLRALVADLRTTGAHIALVAPLPRGTRYLDRSGAPWDGSSAEFLWARKLSELQRQLSTAGEASSYVDCQAEMLDASGAVAREVFPDLLHLSAHGYDRWARCLAKHLKAVLGPPAGGPAGSAELRPREAKVPAPASAEFDDPIEMLWQRPGAAVPPVVVLLAHGCAHQGSDFWPADHCQRCLGLPEEVAILRAVLARGYLAVALTSLDRESGCWRPEDLPRVEVALEHLYREERLPRETPLYAFGASSGGALVGKLAAIPSIGSSRLRCRIPQIMAVPGTPSFADPVAGTWPAPPTLFIHMPRDERTAGRVATALAELWRGNITAAEVHCDVEPITEGFFAARVQGVSEAQSAALFKALEAGGVLDADGLLKDDPRGDDTWREAMLTSGVPQALGDELMPDASRLGEEITRAWAFHEMCATHADAMLDFCDDPSRACASHGWFCVVAGGRS